MFLGAEKKKYLCMDEPDSCFVSHLLRNWLIHKVHFLYNFIQEYRNYLLIWGFGEIAISSLKFHQVTQSY